MADGVVKAVRVQPQSSSLNVFWASSTLQTPGILAAIGHAAARLNPGRGISRRATGWHAAPVRERPPRRRHGSRWHSLRSIRRYRSIVLATATGGWNQKWVFDGSAPPGFWRNPASGDILKATFDGGPIVTASTESSSNRTSSGPSRLRSRGVFTTLANPAGQDPSWPADVRIPP